MLRAALRRASGVTARWAGARLDADSRSFWRKEFRAEFDGLCVRVEAAGLECCIDRVRLGWTVDLAGNLPRISELGPVMIAGAELSVSPSSSPQDSEARGAGPERVVRTLVDGLNGRLLPAWVREARPSAVAIELREMKLGGDAVGVRAALSSADGRGWRLEGAGARPAQGSGGAKPHVRGTLVSTTGRLDGPWRVRLEGGVRPGRGQELEANVTAEPAPGETLALRAEARWRDNPRSGPRSGGRGLGPRDARAVLSGRLGPEDWRLEIESELRALAPGVRAVRVRGCALELGRRPREGGSRRGAFALRCPVRVTPDPGIYGAYAQRGDFPAEFGLTLAATGEAAFPPDLEAPVAGDAHLELESWRTAVLGADGELRARVAGVPAAFPRGWTAEADVALSVALRDFRRAAERLWGSPFPIPAPLAVMSGTVEVGVRGRVALDGREGAPRTELALPIFARTRLDGADQALHLDARGEWRQSGYPGRDAGRLELEVALERVRLALPRLSLAAPPRLRPDPRIRVSPGGPEAAGEAGESGGVADPERIGSLESRIRVRTTRPIELLSNLARAPIPVETDVVVDSRAERPLAGQMRVGSFPIELFRRAAEVEGLRLSFRPELESPEIEGAARVRYATQTVRMQLLGTAREPQLRLSSDPPLPEDRLYATLLFGESPEDLDPGEAESVGSFRQAAARNAIGLASLFLLASTPIQSFRYDPTTDRIAASLKLAAGTSLSVGTEAGQAQLGLRRRLGPRWVISTGLEDRAGDERAQFSALLEWSNRY